MDMTSAFMEAEDASVTPEDPRIADLESQILNSQESLIRVNRELDSALLRITTLENVCAENQNDLHEKRTRLKRLNDELSEQEETIDRLNNELNEKNDQYQTVFGDISLTDLHSQIQFDRQLRELIVYDLDDEIDLSNHSPQTILYQYQHNERLKFYNLLQESLITEDISNVIDSDDILFESLTRLNSLNRLKETLSRDSKELYHIRSLLHLTNDNNDQQINDLINKQQSIEYLRTKIDKNQNFNDFDLIKHVLHDYFNFQQQQNELKEYLHLDQNNDQDLNYSRVLIERYDETIHIQMELNERIKNQDEIIEQLKNQLNETIEQNKEIDELLSKFPNQEEANETSQLDRIQAILQMNMNLQQTSVSENSDTSNEKEFDQNQQLIIDELTQETHKLTQETHELSQEIFDLKQEANQRKNQLKELTKFLETESDVEETQINLFRSLLESLINFRLELSNKLLIENDNESILQRIEDYQLIINELNSEENEWTNETTDVLINKLQIMKNAEDLQKRLDESIEHEKQLQIRIKEIADQFASETDDNEESDLIRIHQTLESLTNFRQNISDKTPIYTEEDTLQLSSKQDIETQTIDNDEFSIQIAELIGVDKDDSEEIINRIRELLEISQTKNENLHQLQEEHEKLITKETNLDKSIERMMNKMGLSSDSSSRTRIDEICTIFDQFSLNYCQLTSLDIEKMNLIEIFDHIQLFLKENNQLKELINQIDSDQSNYISKLQTYLTKVDNLCQLISPDNANIDQALITYQQKIEHDNDIIEKISNFKQQLLTRLSIDDEDRILGEIERINTDLKKKLQNNDESASTLISLNTTISEQRKQILECEETAGKLRSQRERMLSKMKEMKTNNETVTDELKQANQSIDELHRKEIDYKNQIEEIEQQLRSAHNQIQVTLDDCRTQQDLQETMKLEIESIQHEMETQKKLYENRCRQIVNEKNQLDKNSKELLEEKQIFEDENKRLQTILYTIKDTLENVDDINSIVDTIVKLRRDYFISINELNQSNEKLKIENENLLLNLHEQESRINEYIQIKNQLEKRLFDNEQQIINFRKEIEENNNQYQSLQNEYESYKENNQIKIINQEILIESPVATINIEQSSPHLLPVQQAVESNDWTSIDMKDEEIPLTASTAHKHSTTTDNLAAVFNMLGELKSKLGITLTHRPRSSSVFFLYLCAVHILTLYLLFIRHC